MSSKDYRNSHAQRTSTNKRKSKSSSQSRKQPNPSNSNTSASSQLHFTNDASGTSARTTSFNSTPQPLNGKFQPIISTSMTNHQPLYAQQYSTDVISGYTSLGVDAPPYTQQALLDQHSHSTAGQYLYSVTVANTNDTPEFQRLVVDCVTEEWLNGESMPTYGYTCRIEDLNGDLTGIGAQFEG